MPRVFLSEARRPTRHSGAVPVGALVTNRFDEWFHGIGVEEQSSALLGAIESGSEEVSGPSATLEAIPSVGGVRGGDEGGGALSPTRTEDVNEEEEVCVAAADVTSKMWRTLFPSGQPPSESKYLLTMSFTYRTLARM